MANQPETASYDSGVYQLATTDPVQGGVGGIANAPLLNLANRTAYLKQHVDNIENGTTVPTGLAVKNSPIFTGDPQAPTPALGDNDTSISTTAFVQSTINGVLTKSVAGGVNVTLSAIEAGNGILILTGALTANIAVIVPTSGKQMLVVNRTTGAYSLTVKTASGTGIVVAQNKQQELGCDGTNVILASNDFTGIAIDGTPTLTNTPAQFDNSQNLVNSAFVQRALGNMQGSTQLGVGATTTLTAAQVGRYIQVQGGTATLPATASVAVGSTFYFSSSAASTVACPGADRMYIGGTGYSGINLASGDWLGIVLLASGAWEVFTSSIGATAPQFDASLRFATTAFVRGASQQFSNVTVVGTNRVLTAADMGGLIVVNAQCTVYLPVASSIPLGQSVTIWNATGSPYIVAYRQGSDTLNTGATSVLGINIQAGDCATFTAIAGSSWAMMGTAALQKSQSFMGVYGQNGYQKLPGGFILQWGGNVTDAGSAYLRCGYPIQFPTQGMNVICTPASSNFGSYTVSIANQDINGFDVRSTVNNAGVPVSFNWIALGN